MPARPRQDLDSSLDHLLSPSPLPDLCPCHTGRCVRYACAQAIKEEKEHKKSEKIHTHESLPIWFVLRWLCVFDAAVSLRSELCAMRVCVANPCRALPHAPRSLFAAEPKTEQKQSAAPAKVQVSRVWSCVPSVLRAHAVCACTQSKVVESIFK